MPICCFALVRRYLAHIDITICPLRNEVNIKNDGKILPLAERAYQVGKRASVLHIRTVAQGKSGGTQVLSLGMSALQE